MSQPALLSRTTTVFCWLRSGRKVRISPRLLVSRSPFRPRMDWGMTPLATAYTPVAVPVTARMPSSPSAVSTSRARITAFCWMVPSSAA